MLRKGMLYPAQPPADVPEKEYIRKDIVDETIKTAEDHAYFAGREKLRETLLEWIEVLKAQSLELREKGYGDVFYGAQITILEEIIDKIKSL